MGLGLSADLATLAPGVAAAGSWPCLKKEVHLRDRDRFRNLEEKIRQERLLTEEPVPSEPLQAWVRPALADWDLGLPIQTGARGPKGSEHYKALAARDCTHRSRPPVSPRCRPPGTSRVLSESRQKICALEASFRAWGSWCFQSPMACINSPCPNTKPQRRRSAERLHIILTGHA